MTQLRTQLNTARAAYAAIRYPGDIAAEVIVTRLQPHARWIIGAIVSGAMAASVLLGVMLVQTAPASGGRGSQGILPMVKDVRLSPPMRFEMPGLPGFPRVVMPHVSLREMAPPNLLPSDSLRWPSLEDLKMSMPEGGA